MKSNPLFYHERVVKPTPAPSPSTVQETPPDWKEKYTPQPNKTSYRLEDSADDSELNRAIQLKSFDNTDIIEGKPGKMYFDKATGKVKVYVSDTIGWKNLAFEP